MKILKTVLAALIVLSVTAVQAQKIKVTNGDLGFLNGQTELLLEYDYSNMAVGKFDNEADYVAKKIAELNEKEAGSGEAWHEKWVADRDGRFHPKFEELANNYTKKANCNVDQTNINAKYTAIVKVTFLEPGWNIGISRRDAMINLEISFVETANHDNVLAVMTMTNVPGRDVMGTDFDAGYRIGEAYAKGGKEFGAFLVKKAFK
ncbi:MAG TPA: hypothetical protein DCG75_07165 [Bacteroidales bacterium]|jgi:hypothetical protein|nr:hypothetical protein [Bacteroidales bacterium]